MEVPVRKVKCLVCEEDGKAIEEKNLWEEMVWVLRCTHCHSIITSVDGIHWNIFYQCNKWRNENTEEKLENSEIE